MPEELFKCKRLQTLRAGNNCLQTLPLSVQELSMLSELQLKGNLLDRLPVELSECRLLRRSGLVVEEFLFNMLPPEVKEQISVS